MEERMRRVMVIGLVALFLASGSALAATRMVPAESVGPQDVPQVQLVSTDQSGVDLLLDLPTLSVETLAVDGREFQNVAIPGGSLDGDVGKPGIPTFSRLVQIPAESGVTVTVTPVDEEDIPGINLMPVQSEDSATLDMDAVAYAREGFDTTPGASVGPAAIARDLRVVPVTFRPVRYDAARKVLRVARQLRVRVDFTGRDLTNALTRTSDFIPESFDRLYKALVVNYASPGSGAKSSASQVGLGTWLVICPNDAGVTSRLQTLMDWRKREGYTVRLATTAETGTTNNAIKAYIQNAYNTWTPPLEYVVLAGDGNGAYTIPTFTENLSGYGGEGDHPYSQLAGGDVLSDVHLGRLSYSDYNTLDVIIAKSVNYEATPFTSSDPGWFTRACLVGDPGSSGYSTVQVQQWIKTRLRKIAYTQIDTVFAGDFPTQMSTALNRGDTIFCYRGYYGFSGWSNAYTNALTNVNKLNFAVISTCGTGSWAGGTSNSEAFLRAGTVASPKAAVGSVGTATTGTHTRFNNCYTYGTFQGLLYENQWEMGAAHTRGKYELWVNYHTNNLNEVTYFSYWNTLMGDPAVRIWTAFPKTLDVTYPATVPAGSNSVVVTVNQGGARCEGARVCLLKGTETFCSAVTDGSGQVELPVSVPTAGVMKLTVTKYNCQPVLADIAVATPTFFVGYQASIVDDNDTGGSMGNSNGLVNPGETIQLKVQLKNFGAQSAPFVTANLTTDDPYVTITSATEAFGVIAAGASAWSAGDFDFQVSTAAPDSHVVRFGLNVTSEMNQWHSLIDVLIVSADFATSGVTLYNAGNGILDPGETLDMSVALKNQGGANALTLAGTLVSMSPWVSVVDGSGTYGTINVGATGENTSDHFTVQADPGTYQGHLAAFKLITTCNGGALDTTDVALTVGTRSSDDPVGPDRYGYYAFDNTDTSYLEAPVYGWVEIDPNLGGTGTQINLGDFGQYQDKSRSMDMPFSFKFYGNSFTRATVCSNGWLAMGETYLTDDRNWYLPGAGCPQNLVAVFWDDLQEVTSPAGHVYQKFDSANHCWIVEWSRMHDATGGTVTAQAIFYDPAYYPTSTGDGIIVCQYSSIALTDGTDGYATVGIQNADHTDAITYCYFNNYSAGAATLNTGRAIKFLPTTIQPGGTIQGVVRNASLTGHPPLPGAVVALAGTGRTFTSGPDGSYGGTAPQGVYTAVCTRSGFQPDSVLGVSITNGGTAVANFDLVDIGGPEISGVTQLISTTDTTGPYPVQATADDPSGVSTVSLFYRAVSAGWTEAPMTLNGGVWSAAIPGMPPGSQVLYYVRAVDSVGHASTNPSGAPGTPFTFRITEIIYSTDCEDPGDPAWQLGVAGDAATTGIWVRDDPVGTVYNGAVIQPEDDHTPDPGVKCFVTGNGAVGGAAGDNDVDGGCTTLQSPVFDLSAAQWASVRYWRWWGEGGNSMDDEFVVDVSSDGGANWIPLERIPEPMTEWGMAAFDLTSVITLTNQVVFRFVACDLNTAGLVEAAVDDFSLEVFTTDLTAAPAAPAGPAIFALGPGRPNPFANSTTLSFSMQREGTARLAIFDASGRIVRELVNGPVAAGTHTRVWDGRNDRGAVVPSGIYFYRLDAGGQQRQEKLLRLK
jgi:hypothetical protein